MTHSSDSFFDNNTFTLLPFEQMEGEGEGGKKKKNDFSCEINAVMPLLPLLPLTETVLFPSIIMHITLEESQNIRVVTDAYKAESDIGIVSPLESNLPLSKSNLHPIGTRAKIHRVASLPSGKCIVILKGVTRMELVEVKEKENIFLASVHDHEERILNTDNARDRALVQSIKDATEKILTLIPEAAPEVQSMIHNIQDPNYLIYYIAANMSSLQYKQKVLQTNHPIKRGKVLLKFLLRDLQFTKLKHKIHHQVHEQLSEDQRTYYIRKQIQELEKELSEEDEHDEIVLLRKKAKIKALPERITEAFEKKLKKAERMALTSADRSNLIEYLHTMLDLPWEIYSRDKHDIANAKRTLDKSHYGMDKVKARILEFLAVHQLTQKISGPILCLCGPPGVGKTSLCKPMAQALGRKYVRMSLGGLHDESELRGHRKTYVGAMLGRVIGLIKKAGTANPLFVFDEIDKIAMNTHRGDPSAAMLEILDPSQNHTFQDNYLEEPFDLSKVMFIATANDRSQIPLPLQDRMEFIELDGYALEEKVVIATKHLLSAQRKVNGITGTQLRIPAKTLAAIIETYTAESGVRELNRKIGQIARKAAMHIVSDESYPKTVRPADLHHFLGSNIYDRNKYQEIKIPGVAIGLAWSTVGGDILFIEATLMLGEGKVAISGQLGEVMEESVTIAHAYLKANAHRFGIDERVFANYDLHVHVPDGSTPKDGPSAGITLFTSLLSLYTQHKVVPKLAMTGEITLRGTILPVGGIKEKILAAKRAGMQQIILSKKNKKDILQIKPEYIQDLAFHYLEDATAIPDIALEKQMAPQSKVWVVDEDCK
jgi:ATP-dependent Lon protease